MFLELFDRNPFGTNCWLLGSDGSDEAVAVDPGFDPRGIGDSLAGGDLVFLDSIGRSDFSNSSPEDMERSLAWFLSLDDGTEVLPGHGERTTVGRERRSNPFLSGR